MLQEFPRRRWLARNGRYCRALILGVGAVLASVPASAQEWRLGAQVGRIHYDGAAATSATTGTSLALGLSRLSMRDWLGATVGLPLEDQPFWLVGGVWKQWRQRGALGLGLDVSGHGFLQRELDNEDSPLIPIDDPAADRSGEGAGAQAALLGFARTGPFQLEIRGGAAAQTSVVGEVRVSRALPVLSASAGVNARGFEVALEGESWWAVDSVHSYAGVRGQWVHPRGALWATAGSWLEGGAGGAVLGAGLSVPVSERLQVEGSWREEAFDPLYESTTARSFSLGMSLRLGGGDVVHAPVPVRYEQGRAVIRIAASEVVGAPRIAGDFTDWQPQPMEARDGAWEYRAQLAPGVYTYAFVNERGEWFVPESVPGRRSDGMGGYNAVLIVE